MIMILWLIFFMTNRRMSPLVCLEYLPGVLFLCVFSELVTVFVAVMNLLRSLSEYLVSWFVG